MAEKSYLDSVGNYLKTLNDQGLAVRFGVVFGSWAKGNPGQWSDIDLMVVSPRFDGPRNRRDVDLLWRLAARIDSRIEPFPVEKSSGKRMIPAPSWKLPAGKGSGLIYFRKIKNPRFGVTWI